MRFLKLLLAGCFVYAMLMAGAGIGFYLKWPAWAAAAAGVLLAAMAATLVFYLSGGRRAVFGQSRTPEEVATELRDQGLLESASFNATRAFQVEEFEDEGLHYFLELRDNAGVLFLSGQYLYDFDPIDDDPELNQSRRFPCTDFTVHRHRTKRYVVDISCTGEPIEPEVKMSPFSMQEHESGLVPEDGAILSSRSFEAFKSMRGAAQT